LISQAYITHWRAHAPWSSDAQIEQDLVLSRAMVEVFNDPTCLTALAFRGGTALHKLFLQPAGRYSEDLDLVQVEPGPIGPVIGALRAKLTPWLGEPRWKQGEGIVTLIYRFQSEVPPVVPLRLKVEINTREHFTHLGFKDLPFAVESPWFKGKAMMKTYHLEELLGTKLRALYQRKKGRDLFDLWLALTSTDVDPGGIAQCFHRYMEFGETPVSRPILEANLKLKLEDPMFNRDVLPLLTEQVRSRYEAADPFAVVLDRLLPLV
jgi:predicted nucleotidyltransferase component of viral defense system